MTDSSSSEGECYESADEGFDDDVVGPSPDPAPVESRAEEPGQSEPAPPSALQYRKRPERGKAVESREEVAREGNRKASLNEQIFGGEMMKPEALIQGIASLNLTSNISRNLNKGIHTIQQTSSSIKDLVLGSLPVSSHEELIRRFSYDDDDDDGDDVRSDSIPNAPYVEHEKQEFDVREEVHEPQLKDSPVTGESLEEAVKEGKCMEESDANRDAEKEIFTEGKREKDEEEREEKEENESKEVGELHVKDEEIAGKREMCNKETHSVTKAKDSSEMMGGGDAGLEKDLKDDLQFEKSLIQKDSVNSCLSVVNDNVAEEEEEEEVANARDGWDSELELDEFEIECNPVEPSRVEEEKEKAVEPSQVEEEEKAVEPSRVEEEKEKAVESSRVKEEEKAVERLEENEGWDDFDFDEDAIDAQVTETGGAEASGSEEAKWSGWENFGGRQDTKPKSGWGWGVNALLNTATSVTQGISNVLEAGLGAPDPEQLARMERESSRGETEEVREDNVNLFPDFGLTNLVAGVTNKLVERTMVGEIGSRVISGGLDTLENLGKKTMEVLQEGDPGLVKKRSMLLGPDKPILSQVLREAKTRAEIADRQLEAKQMARVCHFETLFDDFQGLVHLEALEMLSKQCELKLEQMKDALTAGEVDELIGIMEEVKELCAMDGDEFDAEYSTVIDFRISLERAVEPLKNQISIDKILRVYEESESWLKSDDAARGTTTPVAAFQKAISTLAELTAATVQQYHKGGELLSIKEHRKTVEEADALLRITGVLCAEVNQMCDKFLGVQRSLEREGNEAESGARTSKIKEEAENAVSYIKEAFDLLVPVLQLGAAT